MTVTDVGAAAVRLDTVHADVCTISVRFGEVACPTTEPVVSVATAFQV